MYHLEDTHTHCAYQSAFCKTFEEKTYCIWTILPKKMVQNAEKTLGVGGNSCSVWFTELQLQCLFKGVSGFRHYIISRASHWLPGSLALFIQPFPSLDGAYTDCGSARPLHCVLALSIWAESTLGGFFLKTLHPSEVFYAYSVKKKLFQMALLLCNCKNSITERNHSIKAFGKKSSAFKPLYDHLPHTFSLLFQPHSWVLDQHLCQIMYFALSLRTDIKIAGFINKQSLRKY